MADAMLGALCGALYGMFYGRFAALMHHAQWRVVTFAGFYLLAGFAIGALVGILCKVSEVKKSFSATNMSSDTERHHRARRHLSRMSDACLECQTHDPRHDHTLRF